jgi:DNA-directed RNA polymerase alpha subunit
MFVVESFESDYVYSVDNSLCRGLFDSIKKIAISSVKIASIACEFQSVSGIVEYVAGIVLDLNFLIKSHSRDTINLVIDVDGERVVTAVDIYETFD